LTEAGKGRKKEIVGKDGGKTDHDTEKKKTKEMEQLSRELPIKRRGKKK